MFKHNHYIVLNFRSMATFVQGTVIEAISNLQNKASYHTASIVCV